MYSGYRWLTVMAVGSRHSLVALTGIQHLPPLYAGTQRPSPVQSDCGSQGVTV